MGQCVLGTNDEGQLGGKRVVKGSTNVFNQVDPDHSQEWLNATVKLGGGIVGITRTPSALSRWALSYNSRAEIAAQTKDMFGIGLDDQMTRNESTPARKQRDHDDETKLITVLRRFNVFTPDVVADTLQNVATKDQATGAIQSSPLNAEQYGQEELDKFVEERLLQAREGTDHKSLRDPLRKTKPLTMSSLYAVPTEKKDKDKTETMKVDRYIMQLIITAYESGRKIDLSSILRHELMPVPLSLAELNGKLKCGTKSILVDVLTCGVECSPQITHERNTTVIIDGQARVMAIGKPPGCATFGDLADTFMHSVFNAGDHVSRIDITFDRYRPVSIKAAARQARTKGSRPIRRVIESRDVPLPKKWQNFMALPENKADLAVFLSEEVIENAPCTTTIVVSGGFSKEDTVESSNSNISTRALQAYHEEADTRLVLHCIHTDSDCVVVSSQDTDVLLLLLADFGKMSCSTLRMKTGTSKKTKYLPVHTLYEKLKDLLPCVDVETILSFHAFTGCDTVSYIAGHSKKTAWREKIRHW